MSTKTIPEIDPNHLGFHYTDRWWFARRTSSGEVLLYQSNPAFSARLMLTIDANSWASIMSHVSGMPETSGRFRKALAFHMEQPGTECASSPTGLHQVDTSMESGPNNCFHCEKPMPTKGQSE